MSTMRALSACILCVLLFSCGKGRQAEAKESDDTATPVEVAHVETRRMDATVQADAILFPLRQSSIAPKISAPVQRFLVQRGDHVKQGQLLAVLEDRDLAASAQESKQLFEVAQANLENTRSAVQPDELIKAQTDVQSAQENLDAAVKVYASRQKLYQEGALAQKLVQDAEVARVQAESALKSARQHLQSLQASGQSSQLRAAQAQAEAAKAHYESAAVQHSYAEIRSPIDGVISDRPLNTGEIASSGSPLITVVDISQVIARANLPVDSAVKVRKGQKARISEGDAALNGTVTVVSPAVDPNTTTIQVWANAANERERLKLGTAAKLQIAVEAVPDAVTVPTAALLPGEGGTETVLVAGPDRHAHQRTVKTGVRDEEHVQIVKGVSLGEQVIVSGGLGLDDNAKIKIGSGDEDKSGEESKSEGKGEPSGKAKTGSDEK